MSDIKSLRFGDDRLGVELRHSAETVTVELRDLAGGRAWGPVPLLALDVHAKEVRRTSRQEKLRTDEVRALDGNGAHVTVSFGAHIAAAVWLRVRAGELVVTVVPDEIYERRADVSRVFAVDLLPGLLRVGPAGVLLLPITQGMLCHPKDKREASDRFLLYMEQERWELTPTVPVCGASDPAGGMVILATAGDCDAECRVQTDGQGSGQVGFGASLRRHWPDPVDFARRELRFCPLEPGEDLVLAAAKRLRRYVIEECGKPTLEQRRRDCPEVDYLLGASTIKLFYGMEREGYLAARMEAPHALSYHDYMTFAEAGERLRRLREAGVERVLTQSVGWNPRGHDGLYPTRFPVNERAGGEAGFRALIRLGHELGYQMNVHDNFMMNVPHSPDWQPEWIVQDMFGQPMVHGWWAGGVEYCSWPLALPPERVEGHMQRVKALGLRGMYYADYMIQPLEVNYHPRHRGPRSACARGMVRIIEAAKGIFGACGTEMGTLPGVLAADSIVTAGGAFHLGGCDPAWPITRLLETPVPVWSLALHGLVMLESHPGTRWKGAMESVLKGGHPRDEWSVRPGHHPVLDDARVRAWAAVDRLCVRRFGHLQAQELLAAQWQGDVQESRFADGTHVLADFARQELVVNGERIARPPELE